ncbi:hypothetical protein R1flu_026051 [Riccia fluitans]|uniref:Uncharacterized protein n=1 Tax=Riccia fluitans TaxID=41844 RepID=A0ABD1XEV7_9MARC
MTKSFVCDSPVQAQFEARISSIEEIITSQVVNRCLSIVIAGSRSRKDIQSGIRGDFHDKRSDTIFNSRQQRYHEKRQLDELKISELSSCDSPEVDKEYIHSTLD